MTHQRSAGRQVPFIFKTGDNIRELVISVEINTRRIKGFKSGCQDHRSYIDGKLFFLIIKIDGIAGAELFACPAFSFFQVNTIIRINHIFERYGLAVFYIGSLAFAKVHVEFIIYFFGAFFSTDPAGDAFIHVNIPGFLFQINGKITCFPGYGKNIRKG